MPKDKKELNAAICHLAKTFEHQGLGRGLAVELASRILVRAYKEVAETTARLLAPG